MSATERRLHERVLALAAVALDFGLAPPEHALLADHLAGCPACARGVAGLRGDAAALRRPAELATSARLDAAVAAAIAGQPARRPAASRTLVLVAATALLLVALLGLAAAGAFLLHDRLPAVVVPPPSAPAVVVPVSPGPDASAKPAPSASPAWQVGSIPPMFEGGMAVPVAIAAGPTTFALVGGRVFRDNQAPSGGTASAWRSTDAITWQPATADAGLAVGDVIPVDDEPTPGLADVAWGPPGFVAVGIRIETGDRIGGIWRSTDGIAWARAELPDAARARPAAVTWTGAAYVAVGTVREDAAPRAAAWSSADGRSWRRVPDGEAFDIGGYITYPSAYGGGGLADVAVAPDGSLVAVGYACTATARMEEQSTCHPIVLRSSDGESWTVVPGPSPTGVGLSSVAASGGRFVAVAGGQGATRLVHAAGPVGIAGTAAQVAIIGSDAWRLVEPAGVPLLQRIVASGDGFLAVSSADSRIRVWASPDGEAWTEVQGVPQPPLEADPGADPADTPQAFSDVDLAAAGDRVAVVGFNNMDPAGPAAFSIVGSAPLATVPPTPAALRDCPGGTTVLDQAFEADVIRTDYAWTPYAFRRAGAVGGVALAQTLTVGRSGSLAGLELRLSGRDLVGDLPVEVRDGGPDGAVLARGTLGRADLEARGWIVVPLDPAPTVRSGQVVAITLPALEPTRDADAASAQATVTWISSPDDGMGYAGGTGFMGARDGLGTGISTWGALPFDRHVRTYVCAGPSALR